MKTMLLLLIGLLLGVIVVTSYDRQENQVKSSLMKRNASYELLK